MPTLLQIDAFTDRAFAGNPAAVCFLEQPCSDQWLQAVAAEMNLSETAFLEPAAGPAFKLRWFTPRTEVELCGHATLASAHALWETERLAPEKEAVFETLSGQLRARRLAAGWIRLDFPAEAPEEVADAPRGALEDALGCRARWIGRNRFDWLIELGSEQEVCRLAPDMRALEAFGERGFIVTAAAETAGRDFVSRFFGPAVGVDEDPVTGSAHCCLGPFWSARWRRDELTGYQASQRGGVVKLRVAGERVQLIGQAVTVLRGELLA